MFRTAKSYAEALASCPAALAEASEGMGPVVPWRWGPLVVLPSMSDGLLLWRAVPGVALLGWVVVRNHYGWVRGFRCPRRAAEWAWEV